MSFWSFIGKLALFDMLFNAHSSDSKNRKMEYPSYTRRYGYDYEDCDCGCGSDDYISHDSWSYTRDPDPYDSDDW